MEFAEAESGPKMQACAPRERAFVWHYLLLGGEPGCATEAARQAGYADTGTGAIRVQACHLMQRERVLAALDEVGRKAFRSLLIPAVAAAQRLVENPKHPDHAKAVMSTLSRLGLVERSGVDVQVSGEVVLTHTEEAVAQLRALKSLGVPQDKLIELFGHSGLTRYEAMLIEYDRRAVAGKIVQRETIEGTAVELLAADGGG